MKSGEPHEKQVPAQARGYQRKDGRRSAIITHHLVTAASAAKSQ